MSTELPPAAAQEPIPPDESADVTPTDATSPDAPSTDEPSPDAPSAAETTDAQSATAVPGPRRAPRTAVLLVGALLLGPLLGGGLGYLVQAAGPATPLPALQPSVLPSYPAGALGSPAAAAAADKPLAIDGDLRKLLIAKPDGAADWDGFGFAEAGEYETVGQIARAQGSSATVFSRLLTAGLRRAVINTWEKDGVKYKVELMQYASDSAGSAYSRVGTESGSDTHPLPNGMEGAYYAATKPEKYSETTEEFYYGEGVTRRGDLVVRVEAFGGAQVNADVIRDLVKQQWERLA
ncbi:hypothetical protein C7C46_23080 [Streptomyces tateyamensis]|uniref:Uncharacterized protein n=1 Tax=Streptomyces tateyamensis TaxID=565073 RepID=A0A2V4MXQ3_9ACTN|nr:hypothetical protein [Streptomyces tateyamensis]PYC76096.1 hypothetical protein C7C46_23080 [Streptomyces tateyamensis]